MNEELILVLVIGIILPILFTPILIDAVQDDTIGIIVDFEYPKNQINLKSDTESQLIEIFATDKLTIRDSVIVEFFASDRPVITDSVSIETFYNEQLASEFDAQVSDLMTDQREVIKDE